MPSDAPSHDRTFADRMARLRAAMVGAEIDVTMVSVGADLRWLTG
jgi:hypothetical protein